MYIMYVDESGDSGLNTVQSRYFCLSGIVVHEASWRNLINDILAFRKVMRSVYNLPVRSEIHASELIKKNSFNIKKHDRLSILRNFLDELAKFNYISVTNVVVDKHGKPAGYDVFGSAWGTLFQLFENTLRNGNFPGAHVNDMGVVITDATAGTKLMRKVRKMAVHNPIPHMQQFGPGYRNIPIIKIIEDPSERNSKDSYPIQACDVIAYFLTQYFAPNRYIRKKNASGYFQRVSPILNTHASKRHRLGIVLL